MSDQAVVTQPPPAASARPSAPDAAGGPLDPAGDPVDGVVEHRADTAGESAPPPDASPDDSSPDDSSTDEQTPLAADGWSVVHDRLAAVEAALTEFHRRSGHRESVIDRLHEENQKLRSGVQRAVLEPVIADLIRLYDQLDREARRLDGTESEAAASKRGQGAVLRSFADDVLLILDRCGLEVFSAAPGEVFQPDRHRPVGIVPCDDAAQHNTVAEPVASGFTDRETGRVRRVAHTLVHQHRPPPEDRSGDEPAPAPAPAAAAAPAPDAQ